jgi:hypothetical protein
VRKYTTTTTDTGSSITAVNSSTLGLSCTINQAGAYAVRRRDKRTGGVAVITVTVNVNSGLSAAISFSQAAIMCTAPAGTLDEATGTLVLAVGDVVRPHDFNNTNDDVDGLFEMYQVSRI